MAEVAGLVLGVVGIAGVIGAFQDAVDLFSLMADSRRLVRDRVKLLSDSYDKRLDDRDTQRLVVKILECVATLLSDAPKLQQRYGLDAVPADSLSKESGGLLVSMTPRVSDGRWGKFLQDYAVLRQRPNSRQPVPAIKQFRWIITDKQKFEGLVQQLAHFTAKLNEVIPVASDATSVRIMTDQDVEAIRDLKELKILLEASVGLQKTVMDSTQHILSESCKDHILNKLWFRKIDDRRESILPACDGTINWVLEHPGERVLRDDLSAWIRSGSGIYWVSGKAGSGKSTLMKHLYLSDDMRALLSEWARGERCLIGNFFFMHLGTTEQKSQEGLSRTLLYQILLENRDLIPEVLPQMWREIYCMENKNSSDDISLPSQAETRHAFGVISTFIKHLAANGNIKVIVSSRPIPDCVAAFGDLPTLRLQDLNYDDIATYVNDTIGGHEYTKKLIRRCPGEGEQITKDIIEKSSGVFLWVVLACRSLLSGFADHDHISELRRRVDELPSQLEDMFQHMLGKIKTRHREQGARLLRLYYAHQTAPWPNACLSLFRFAH